MNSPKVRKSWFCGSPTTTQLHLSGVPQTLGPDLNCQLLVTATGENREPICVTASDVLTLTTFSPRAVVDFGTENFTDRPFVRYLLLENPHNEDQCVSIRRGLPPDEFMLTWIESEHTLMTQSDPSWKTPGYQLPTSSSAPDSICVRGSHGRCLLRISWTPSQPKSSDNGGGGFYHIIQFRVNDAFPLQALVVGRLLAPVMERKTRMKRPQRLQPTGFSIPRGITALQRTCSYDRFHTSQTAIPTAPLIERGQRGGLERSLSAQYFDEESASFERPKHSLKGTFSGRAQTTTVQTAIVEDAVPERVSRVSSAHFQSPLRRQSVSLPRLPGPKCTVLDELSAPPAFPLHKTRSTAFNLTLVNATAVGFVSPKLIRSPALKRDPQLTLKNEPSGTYYSGQAGGNLFYPNFSCSLSELSERGLTQWLNSVFAPCIAANSNTISAEIPCALGGRSYWISLNNAVDMLHTPIMTGPGQRVEREVDEGKIVPMYDLSFRVDKAVNRDQLHNRHAIKRFLILLWFLDRLKSNRLVEYNPCLFRFRSHIKSSAEMVLHFARNFLTGENNLVRHLANLGVHLEVTQTPLDEYELTVSNLAVDLRDGIRLVKLAELLLPLMPKAKSRFGDYPAPATLMSLVRFPAISRLQKIHNVGLALKAFERHGRLCMADGTEIDPRDVVDGHREKSLALLWCLLLRYQVLSLVDVRLLNEEIERLRSMPTGDKAPDLSGGEEAGTHSDDVVHMKLFLWASLVCRLYQVEVLNLDESFSDGRALCVLLHHYLPTLMPGGLVRHLTTSTASSYHLARRTPHLARANRYNLQLFQRKLSYLGDVPVLLEPTMMSDLDGLPGVLPPGLVLATLAYLVSRLISIGRQKLRDLVEDHAARILQTAWRKRRQLLQTRNLRLLSCHKPTTPPRSHLLTGHIESWVVNIQRICRSYLARKHRSKLRCDRERRTRAAVYIQACWRGFLTRQSLIQKHNAALQIQAWWRCHTLRRKLLVTQRWIVDVQRTCRAHLARQRLDNLVNNVEREKCAAVVIQSCWRGFLARRQLFVEQCAAVRIQTWWRGKIARQNWIALRRWVVDVQSMGRAYLAREHYSNMLVDAERRNLAAIRIQSFWRTYLSRRQLAAERCAAVRIQALWRGILARRKYVATYQLLINVQRVCRAHLARKRFSDRVIEAERRNRSAVLIQSYWRGLLARQQLAQQRSAAVYIQAWWRGQLAKQKWFAIRLWVIDLQRTSRRYLVRTQLSRLVFEAEQANRAAVRIQSCWRGFLERRQISKERSAAVRIQAWWRGQLVRRKWRETCQTVGIVQAYVRGFLARRRVAQLRRTAVQLRAATVIQAFWRGSVVRRKLSSQRLAASRIQHWWRGRIARQRFVRTYQAVVVLQVACRSYLARCRCQQLRLQVISRRELAARTLQHAWRSYRCRQRCIVEHEAAKRIQHWWRGRLRRIQWRRTIRVVLWIQRKWRHILFRRHEAACLIQRCWRTHGLRRYLHRRRIAATVIQSCWRGVLLRKQLAKIAGQRQAQKNALTKGKVETAVIQRTNKLKPKCSKIIFGLHFDSSEAHRLIRIRTQLFAATKIAVSSPDRRLCARARAAANCLIHSRSVTQVLQAIKELEIFTRLSSEICFWSVGVLSTASNSSAKSQFTPHPTDQSPLLHLLFLDVIQACNRSVPHEDILLRVTGTLLNIVRHRRLAEHASLWWTPPSSQVDHETWISPALIARTRSRLSLSLSPTRRLSPTTDTEKQCLNSPSRPHRDHSDDRSVTVYSSVPLDSQTSVVEALIGILLRTWRARPGTLGIRLFARTACLLAMLCDAIPMNLLPTTSLLPVIRELSDCLARRGGGPQPRRLDAVEHTTSLLEQTAERMRHTMSDLRRQLSYDLEWHLYPVKTRADPAVAIDFLLLTVACKSAAC
ncbi:hypothetical protein CRM22_002974 [Opisthorchis felineus]|uniref:Calponin-homology (CH) domain-containing protein n=1 Tax=Opisthorchis felineus TaxID=147828 RepID=A0A4S2M3H3_OPIFE|nr:hypothetical protein CRM22_002974 [Opisthorchis felineus]